MVSISWPATNTSPSLLIGKRWAWLTSRNRVMSWTRINGSLCVLFPFTLSMWVINLIILSAHPIFGICRWSTWHGRCHCSTLAKLTGYGMSQSITSEFEDAFILVETFTATWRWVDPYSPWGSRERENAFDVSINYLTFQYMRLELNYLVLGHSWLWESLRCGFVLWFLVPKGELRV